MSIGLDLGSTQFRSLRCQGGRLIGRACRVEVLRVNDTPAHRRLLDRDAVRYADCDDGLYVLADDATEWSRLLSLPIQRLLPDGMLPHDDAISRQILSLMVDSVLPISQRPGEICCLTIPGELMPTEQSIERDFFCRVVRLRGYEPHVIGQGHAVALAELNEGGFSGLGISLGASQCEFSLNRSGREIARCSIPWGSDELQESAGESPDLLTEFLVELLLEAGARINQHDGLRVLTQPVVIACGGGITHMPEFQRQFQQAWTRAAWPIQLKSVRLSQDATYGVARGCLIGAALESQTDAMEQAA